MLLVAKLALGVGGTILLAGAYTFHEGVLRVSVDEHRPGGSHVHLYLPAAVVPMAVRFAPRHRLEDALRDAKDWLPTVRVLSKELRKYPNADFVEVTTATEHVHVRTHDGKLQIDVETPDESVHVACPLVAVEDLFDGLEANRSGV
jgi:hypothetical protein